MTTTNIWDDPELKSGGDFVTFDKVGDKVSGTINAVRSHRFDDGKVVPQILLTTDDGEEKTLTGGAIRLKLALVEQRPEPGDHLTVELTQEEKRSGGKTLRHWNVQVKRGNGQPAQADPATTAAPTPVSDQAALQAAMANLTPEQKAALGLK